MPKTKKVAKKRVTPYPPREPPRGSEGRGGTEEAAVQEIFRQQFRSKKGQEQAKQESPGRESLDDFHMELTKFESEQKSAVDERVAHFNRNIAVPIVEKINALPDDEAQGWKKSGITTASRMQYITAFCSAGGPISGMKDRGRIEAALNISLNFLPRVIYRCFGCRHDFYDTVIAHLSFQADLGGFEEEFKSMGAVLGIPPLNFLKTISGWDAFRTVLESNTTNTPKLEKAWKAFQASIYDWINGKEWGKLFQCAPIILRLPRKSGDPNANIAVLQSRLTALDADLLSRLCGVFDTNGAEGRGICGAGVVDMRGSLATIDGAGVVPAEGAVVVGRINPNFQASSGYLTIKDKTMHLQFVYDDGATKFDKRPEGHKILIYWGEGDSAILLASCPNKLSVNQLISNLRDEGWGGAAAGQRGKSEIESCDFWFHPEVDLNEEQKAIILEAAKALGDKFPTDVAMAISAEGTLGEAIKSKVLVNTDWQNLPDALLDTPVICIGQTGDGLCALKFIGSGQACLLGHGKTMEVSIPANVISSDIKPILIKSFGLKLIECESFLAGVEQCKALIKSIEYSRGDLLATQIQKMAAAKRLTAYFTQTRASAVKIRESFGSSELIDDLFGALTEDESHFPRLIVHNPKSCNVSFEFVMHDEPETRGDKLPQSLQVTMQKLPGAIPVIMMASGYSTPIEVLKNISEMLNDMEKHADEGTVATQDYYIQLLNHFFPGEKVSSENADLLKGVLQNLGYAGPSAAPSAVEILNAGGISLKNFVRYLQLQFRKKSSESDRGKIPSSAVALPDEITFGNALIGAKVMGTDNPAAQRQRPEQTEFDEIPIEIIARIVDHCSLDTILRDYNQHRVIAQFEACLEEPSAQTKITLFKYLSYLSLAIILWFDNNYSELLNDQLPTIISTLILQSLPTVAPRLDILYVILIQLCNHLIPPTLQTAPIVIARDLAANKTLWPYALEGKLQDGTFPHLLEANLLPENIDQWITQANEQLAQTIGVLTGAPLNECASLLRVTNGGGGGSGKGAGGLGGGRRKKTIKKQKRRKKRKTRRKKKRRKKKTIKRRRRRGRKTRRK